MRFRTACMVVVAASLASTTDAFAAAGLQLNVPGRLESQSGQINAGDALGVSRVLVAGVGNSFMTDASNARAGADMRTGTMRVLSDGDITTIPASGKVDGPEASCSLGDKITIHGPGSAATIRVTLTVDGSFSAVGAAGTSRQGSSASVSISSAKGAVNIQEVVSHNLAFGATPVDEITFTFPDGPSKSGEPGSGIAISSKSAANIKYMITAIGTVAVESPIDIESQLEVEGSATAPFRLTATFSNTARLAIALDDGYTFTSASGALLTDPGGPGLAVPDPSDTVGVGGDGGAPVPGGSTTPATGSPSTDGGVATAAPSSDDGGCNTAGVPATTLTGAAGLLAWVLLRARRRR